MAKVLRPIGHDDHLSIVDHLDELRSRLIICGAVLVVAFGFCFWQNQALLKILNRALPASPKTSANHLSGLTSDSVRAAHGLALAAAAQARLAQSPTQSKADRQAFAQAAAGDAAAARALPRRRRSDCRSRSGSASRSPPRSRSRSTSRCSCRFPS